MRIHPPLAAAAALASLVSLGYALQPARAVPPALPTMPAPAAGDAAGAADDEESAPDLAKATVTIVISVHPSAPALVSWGKQRLGRIEPGKPLVVTRPRDSGPLDIIIKPGAGFLPVNTRAHTFSDHKLQVRLTRPDQTTTMVGYRVPLDAGAPSEDGADGGVSVDFAQ